jgi:lipoprotein-anchoring transpeptidase ErfK/SrfK
LVEAVNFTLLKIARRDGRKRAASVSFRAALALSLATILFAAAPAAASPKHKVRSKPVEQSKTHRPVAANAYRKSWAKRGEETKRQGKNEKKKEAVKPPPGPYHVVISIGSQRLTLYANGVQIAQAPVSTGTAGHPTPMGVFTVIQKQVFHRSNLYSSAPMPFMQRITWSGVAMHAGVLPGYPASHGCIRLPAEFATRIYGITKIGARVIVARNDTAPVEIAHPRLFVPKKPVEQPSAQNQPAGGSSTTDVVRTAQAAVLTRDGTGTVAPVLAAETVKTAENSDPAKASDAAKPVDAVLVKAKETVRRGPVSVFVSRKERKLFVRQNSQMLFDTPVTIQNPDVPLGTHVFTAMELKDDGTAMRWTAISIPSSYPRSAESVAASGKNLSRAEREKQAKVILPAHPTAAQALDRIEMPQDAADRIGEILSPGSSLIVSDNGISDETGSDTDFVILTR